MALKLAAVATVQSTSFEAVAIREGFEENLRFIADLGYDGVELAVRDPSLVDADTIVSLLTGFGLHVPAIGTGQAYLEEGLSFADPDPAVRRDAVDRIKQQVEFAKKLDAQVIIGLIRGICENRDERADALDRVGECLVECGSHGTQHDVRLVLEPLNRYETMLLNSIGQTVEFLERIQADNIGILADSFHMNIEEPSMEKSLVRAGDRVAHVHVADSNREAPGHGHIDFRRFVETLAEIGYDGFYSAEILPEPDGKTAIADAVAHMRSL